MKYYYHYDRGAKKATFHFSHMSKQEGLSLAKMHPVIITVIIKSRGELNLVSHYNLPTWSIDDGSSSNIGNNNTEGIVHPRKPLPTVLLVHEGPWARDGWGGYNSENQTLANRAYAVVSVNCLGSTGFRKGLTNAGNLN